MHPGTGLSLHCGLNSCHGLIYLLQVDWPTLTTYCGWTCLPQVDWPAAGWIPLVDYVLLQVDLPTEGLNTIPTASWPTYRRLNQPQVEYHYMTTYHLPTTGWLDYIPWVDLPNAGWIPLVDYVLPQVEYRTYCKLTYLWKVDLLTASTYCRWTCQLQVDLHAVG